MQEHYRGAIRSGFVAHADEDDEEVLVRIRTQSLQDAEWLVNKVGAGRLSSIHCWGCRLQPHSRRQCGRRLTPLLAVPPATATNLPLPCSVQYKAEKEAERQRRPKAR